MKNKSLNEYMAKTPPQTLADLKAAIAESHPTLSKRLRQVAQYLIDSPDKIAFDTVAVIAEDAGVHPSTLVRFANAFGYSGFSEMQRLFQQKLIQESPSYSKRIRIAKEEMGEEAEGPREMLSLFSSANSVAMSQLAKSMPADQIERVIDLLVDAEATHIVGVRRAFTVASYVAYALRHFNRRAFLIDGVGSMYREQCGSIGPKDILFAISFSPYGQETQEVVREAAEKGVPIIVLTDSQLSPLAPLATECFIVREAEVHGFRSLTASLCLVQSLAISLAYRLEDAGRKAGSIR